MPRPEPSTNNSKVKRAARHALYCVTVVVHGILASMPARAESPMILAHMFPFGSAPDAAAQHFANLVAESTNGDVALYVAGNAAVGDERQNVVQLAQGSIAFALTGDLFVANILPEAKAASLPFIATTYAAAREGRDGAMAGALQRAAGSYGLEILSSYCIGQRFLTANRPVPDMGSIAGLKLRLPADGVWSMAWQALGAEIRQIPFPDLPLALAEGRVEAQENPPSLIRASGLFRHQKYLMLTGHYVQFQYIVASQAAMAQLTGAERDAVRHAAGTTATKTCETARRQQDSDIAWLGENGMTIVPFDPVGIRERMVGLVDLLEPRPGPDMLSALGIDTEAR